MQIHFKMSNEMKFGLRRQNECFNIVTMVVVMTAESVSSVHKGSLQVPMKSLISWG